MSKRSPHRSTARAAVAPAAAVLGLAALLAAHDDAAAFAVYNSTRYDAKATVVEASDFQNITIAKNSLQECSWTLSSCNPQGGKTVEYRLQIKVSPSGDGQFECWMNLKAGGYAFIFEQDRANLDRDMPPNLYCMSLYDRGDYIEWVDWSDPFMRGDQPPHRPLMDPANRDVHFLVTADPQYSRVGEHEPFNANADATMKTMKEMLWESHERAKIWVGDDTSAERGPLPDPYYRGIIVAGDLIQSGNEDGGTFDSREWEEGYLESLGPLPETGEGFDFHHFGFEGLGNHDLFSFPAGSDPSWREDVRDEADLYVYIEDKLRNTRLTSERAPHYSWDWHDVHFVQLNLYPGSGSLTNERLPHFNSLDFLKADLATYVGDTGRPVVLIHHYFFATEYITCEAPSPGGATYLTEKLGALTDWTLAEAKAYWDAIRDYNVVAIFTGHRHLAASDTGSSWVRAFVNPYFDPAKGLALPQLDYQEYRCDGREPERIPAFIVGAARGTWVDRSDHSKGVNDGVFLAVEINDRDEMIVRRLDQDGNPVKHPQSGQEQVETLCIGPRCDPGAQCVDRLSLTADSRCEATVAAADVYDGAMPSFLNCHVFANGELTYGEEVSGDPIGLAGLGSQPIDLYCENRIFDAITPWSSYTSSCSTPVTVTDTTEPGFGCSGPGIQECGAPIDFTVSPFDNCTANQDLNATCIDAGTGESVSPGDAFSNNIGPTRIRCTASDASGNEGQCDIEIEMTDTLPPEFKLNESKDIVQCGIEEYIDNGATAEDLCEGPIPSDRIERTGTVDAEKLGRYLLTYSAEDTRGNEGKIGRFVEVIDTVQPQVTVERTVGTLECGLDSFDPFDVHGARAMDRCDPNPALLYSVFGGTVDASTPGPYQVIYTARDASGVESQSPVDTLVAVVDRIAPAIACPADLVVEPTGPSGTAVTYSAPSADDACNPSPETGCTPESGSTFGVGTTTGVACTADDGYNQSSCSFTVTVLSDEGMVAKLADGADDLLAAGSLNGGQARGLDQQLDVIMAQVQAGDTGSACGQLAGFISHVNDLIAEGVLTAAEGEPLIATANNLRATLGCGRQTAAG